MPADPRASTPAAARFLLGHAGGRRTGGLLALMAGVSLTEGFGVLTLLPVLDRLQGTDGTGGWSARVAAVLGFVPSLAWLLAFMTVLAGIRCVLVYARQVRSVALQNEVVDAVRARAFSAVLHGEWRWLAATRASDHADLILTNVSRVGIGLNQLLSAIALAVAAGGYLAAALLLSWRVALVTVALGAGVLALFAAQRARAERFGVAIGEGGRATHAYVHQTLAGIRVVKAYRGEERRARGFGQVIDALRARSLAHERMTARGQALLQFGSAAALALVLGIGHLGFGVALPVLLPLLLAFARLAPMLGSIQAGWSAWNQMRPAIAAAARFLDEAGRMREPARNPALPPLAGAIRLDGVTVRHIGRAAPALDTVSLTLPALTTTALCGASGAGKSTLADVLMGLIVPDAGAMLVDGVAIEGPARIAWRGAVAYVQQDAFLFHDTIRANVLLGRDLDDAAVAAALVRAGAGFVLDLPDGLDTVVGDAGARLSGGERQRVALARALVGAPALLILDEATSALDSEHEMAVRRTMRALRGQVTTLFITHRTSMREDADQVVTLDRGRVVAGKAA